MCRQLHQGIRKRRACLMWRIKGMKARIEHMHCDVEQGCPHRHGHHQSVDEESGVCARDSPRMIAHAEHICMYVGGGGARRIIQQPFLSEKEIGCSGGVRGSWAGGDSAHHCPYCEECKSWERGGSSHRDYQHRIHGVIILVVQPRGAPGWKFGTIPARDLDFHRRNEGGADVIWARVWRRISLDTVEKPRSRGMRAFRVEHHRRIGKNGGHRREGQLPHRYREPLE